MHSIRGNQTREINTWCGRTRYVNKQNAATSHQPCYCARPARYEIPLKTALHVRQQEAITAGGIAEEKSILAKET